MATQGSTESIVEHNERALKSLSRAIAFSDGQFSLVLVRCNYHCLRRQILQQLQSEYLPNHHIQQVAVPRHIRSLYNTIHLGLNYQQPSALMVLGLESVDALDDLLSTINQVRDEFRKHHPFPMVLWVNDRVLGQLRRLAPDFASWAATPIRFEMTAEDLLQFLQEETDALFGNILKGSTAPTLEGKIPVVSLKMGGGKQFWYRDRDEFSCAIRDLNSRGITLEPHLQADLDFVFGLDNYISDRINQATTHFQQSLQFWQQEVDGDIVSKWDSGKNYNFSFPPHPPVPSSPHLLRQGVLLFYIGLCYFRLAERHESDNRHHWQEAKSYFQQCLQVFSSAQRQDIVAQFIVHLGVVLQQLGDWQDLQQVAQQSLELHQTYGSHIQLACDYGMLAEAALHESHWKQASQFANIALWKLSESPDNQDAEQGLFPLLLAQMYRLMLVEAQQHLGEEKITALHLTEARKTLTTALIDSDYRYDAHRYIRLLRKLRWLYFQAGCYLEAFTIRQQRRSVEQQYGFRAFIGAGKLQPQQQATNPVLNSSLGVGSIALEISASGRQRDVKQLIGRISRPAQKLTIIHGPSGVGKSSTVTAGLVPALQNRALGDQIAIPVVLQVYTDWVRELGTSLSAAIADSKGETEADMPPYPATHLTTAGILEQLRSNAHNQLITVLIFDQFEEFFFGYTDRKEIEEFDLFLCDCLQIPFVKIIFSLRGDYLYQLLKLKHLSALEPINYNILDKNIRYQLNNFSTQDAKNVIQCLTERSQVHLEPELIDALVTDLSSELGEVRPIELQVVGNQLQDNRITKLSQYQSYRHNKLIEQYIKELIADCGKENERAALLVLYLLTDENRKRPFKTKAEITAELAEFENAEQLDLVLEILVHSGLVVLFPDVPERYQLIHDYLVDLIRYLQQGESSLQIQLNQLRQKVQYREAEIAQLNSELRQKNQQVKLLDGLDTSPQKGLNLLTELKELRKREELSQVEIERLAAELQQQKLEAELADKEQQRISEAKINRFLKIILALSAIAIIALTASITMAIYQWRQALIAASQAASASSSALFALDKDIDALKSGLKAGRKLQGAVLPDADAQEEVMTALYQVVYGIKERNRLEAHTSEVNDVSFSPDGKLIASASADNTIKLWQSDGKLLHTFKGHRKKVNSVSFSPNGKTIISGSADNCIKIWSLDGKLLHTLLAHTDIVNSVIFSPDGQTIASASTDKTIRIWNQNGNLLRTIPAHKEPVRSLAWSSDGKIIASASTDKTIKLWDTNGKLLRTLSGHQDTVLQVNWSPDGKTLASASLDGDIKLWNRSGKLISSFSGHHHGLTTVTFSPDGNTIASASTDQTVKIWTLQGELVDTLKGHGDWITSIIFSPDGNTLASASRDTTIKLWHWQDVRLQKLKSHSQGVTQVSFSNTGKLLASASHDNTVKLWQRDGKLLTTLSGHSKTVWDVAFSADETMLASASGDTTVKLWQRDGKLLRTLSGHIKEVLSVAWSKDGKTIASASGDGTLKLWNANGKLLNTLFGHEDAVNWVSFSPNGELLASASDDNTVKIWKRNGELLYTFKQHQRPVYSLAWSADGKTIASASIDSMVKLWTVDGKIVRNFTKDGDRFTSISISADGKLLAATSNDKVRLWNSDGNLLLTLKVKDNQFNSVSFSPDGKSLGISSSAGTIILQNLSDLQLQKLLTMGCSWLQDYLGNNSKVTQSDRSLCVGK
ncbi:MAG: hypothetical protein QNJ63_30335 [Calothrix sp. MO_192.B10]|nr:hypothetical protein [Calothrix sp. MO_192.B10]